MTKRNSVDEALIVSADSICGYVQEAWDVNAAVLAREIQAASVMIGFVGVIVGMMVGWRLEEVGTTLSVATFASGIWGAAAAFAWVGLNRLARQPWSQSLAALFRLRADRARTLWAVRYVFLALLGGHFFTIWSMHLTGTSESEPGEAAGLWIACMLISMEIVAAYARCAYPRDPGSRLQVTTHSFA